MVISNQMIKYIIKETLAEENGAGICPTIIPPLANKTNEVNTSIRTQDVISILLRLKKHKRLKESTIETYEKCFARFERKFPFMPEKLDDILSYLDRYNGETGRYKLNEQTNLIMLYKHAVRFCGMIQNPLEGLERPLVTKKPINTLSSKQGQMLITTPLTLTEMVVLDMMFGHGWRGIEVRRILAKDIANIHDGLILCRGKEREEWAPILPETEEKLRELTQGLPSNERVILADRVYRGRREPLGENGMSQLVKRLYARAVITKMTGHDLRRSFSTLAVEAGCDHFLSMRLLRDTIPGQGDRYIKYPLSRLVEDLKRYSPLRLLRLKQEGERLVETGESRTPPETKILCFT